MFFLSLLFQDPMFYFMWVFLVVFSVCVHEYFHALVALWQGDSTAADSGHLTLNPFVQIGIFPLILLCLIGITWGVTPVNPARFRYKYSRAIVSLAGPFANIALFFIFCFLSVIATFFGSVEGAMLLFGYGAVLNFVLFLFNMLPIPPLDGFSVFAYFFPSLERGTSELQRAAMFIIFLIAFFSFGKLYSLGFIVYGVTVALIKGILGYA